MSYKGIKHIPHPRIGDSLKHSDYFLPDYNIYLEVDGLDRKDDIDWNGKLSLYEQLNLSYKIVKSVDQHFIENKEKCFQKLEELFSFLYE